MAKKKPQFPNRMRNIIISSTVSVLLIGLLIFLVALNVAGRNYVMKFDGEKVKTGEFLVYLYQQKIMYEMYFGTEYWSTAVDDSGTTLAAYAMDSAYSALIQQKIAVKEANKRGLTLSAEQEEEAQTTTDEVKSSFTDAMLNKIGMSDKQLLQFMKNDLMQSILYEDATKDYVFDESDFETYYESYLAENEKSLTTVNINYILTDDEAKAEEVKAKIENGEDIYSLIKEYSVDYEAPVKGEDDEEEPVDERMAPQSASGLYIIPDEFEDMIYEMGEGDISDIYPLEQAADEDSEDAESTFQYIFVKVDNIELPDYDTLKEEQKETYQTQEKDTIYQGFLEGWANESDVILNEEILAKIDITTLPQ